MHRLEELVAKQPLWRRLLLLLLLMMRAELMRQRCGRGHVARQWTGGCREATAASAAAGQKVVIVALEAQTVAVHEARDLGRVVLDERRALDVVDEIGGLEARRLEQLGAYLAAVELRLERERELGGETTRRGRRRRRLNDGQRRRVDASLAGLAAAHLHLTLGLLVVIAQKRGRLLHLRSTATAATR